MTFSYRGFWRGSGALAVAIGKIQKYSAKENIKNKAASEELRVARPTVGICFELRIIKHSYLDNLF